MESSDSRDKELQKVGDHLSENHVDGEHDADFVEASRGVADVHLQLRDPVVAGTGIAGVSEKTTL